MFGLKKIPSRSQVTDTLSSGLTTASNGAKNGANAAYSTIMSHPKATAAVVLGTGAAAAIWWVLRNPERVAALKQQIAARTESFWQSRRARQQRQLSA